MQTQDELQRVKINAANIAAAIGFPVVWIGGDGGAWLTGRLPAPDHVYATFAVGFERGLTSAAVYTPRPGGVPVPPFPELVDDVDAAMNGPRVGAVFTARYVETGEVGGRYMQYSNDTVQRIADALRNLIRQVAEYAGAPATAVRLA